MPRGCGAAAWWRWGCFPRVRRSSAVIIRAQKKRSEKRRPKGQGAPSAAYPSRLNACGQRSTTVKQSRRASHAHPGTRPVARQRQRCQMATAKPQKGGTGGIQGRKYPVCRDTGSARRSAKPEHKIHDRANWQVLEQAWNRRWRPTPSLPLPPTQSSDAHSV